MEITNFQINLTGAVYVDVNSHFTLNTLPDLVPDKLALENSLFNLFNCPIGARGRTFQPEYGSLWYEYLQEPIDAQTGQMMWVSMIQSIIRWEPRIELAYKATTITPDFSLPGYNVVIAGTNTVTGENLSITFQAQK